MERKTKSLAGEPAKRIKRFGQANRNLEKESENKN